MLKEDLDDKNAPFGVDLLLPQVGEGWVCNRWRESGKLADRFILAIWAASQQAITSGVEKVSKSYYHISITFGIRREAKLIV